MRKRNKIVIRFRSIWYDHSKSLILFAFIAFLLAGLSSWDYTYSPFYDEGWLHGIRNFFVNPIGFFGFVIGLITVWGFWFTIESLHDIRNAIHSFPEMIDKVCDLIESTKSEEGDCINLILYTPTTGCLAVEKSRWLDLTDLLLKGRNKRAELVNIQLICMKYEDIANWYTVYKDSQGNPISEEILDFGLLKTKHIIDDFESNYKKHKELVQKKNKLINQKQTNHKVQLEDYDKMIAECNRKQIKYLNWDEFQGYYIFCNDEKAIFTLPSFMPTPNDNLISAATNRKPEMIGFESEQFSVLDTAHSMFKYYWENVARNPFD